MKLQHTSTKFTNILRKMNVTDKRSFLNYIKWNWDFRWNFFVTVSVNNEPIKLSRMKCLIRRTNIEKKTCFRKNTNCVNHHQAHDNDRTYTKFHDVNLWSYPWGLHKLIQLYLWGEGVLLNIDSEEQGTKSGWQKPSGLKHYKYHIHPTDTNFTNTNYVFNTILT